MLTLLQFQGLLRMGALTGPAKVPSHDEHAAACDAPIHYCRPGNAGRVGFGKDMGATRSLRDTDHSGQAMEATAGALLEADRRMTDPPRRFKVWRKVPSWMPDEV